MVLPTPLSWYAHHLPTWYLKAVTVLAIVSELLMPFLFFIPVRSIRITGYSLQVSMGTLSRVFRRPFQTYLGAIFLFFGSLSFMK